MRSLKQQLGIVVGLMTLSLVLLSGFGAAPVYASGYPTKAKATSPNICY